MITRKQVGFYKDHGYLIAEKLINPAEIELLKRETLDIFRGKYPVPGILPALERAAGDEVLSRYYCIHQGHKLSPVLMQFVMHPAIAEVLRAIIGPDVKCMQSMLFVKPPGAHGQAWHQDEKYIPTENRSLTGAWIAMDDATRENGCLWVVSGSHQGPLLPFQEVTNREEHHQGQELVGVDRSKQLPAEAPAGSVVFFNGHLHHCSYRNRSKTGYRRALVNHYMDAHSALKWAGREDYRDIVMIAGRDPMWRKGYEHIARPHLRGVDVKTGAKMEPGRMAVTAA